MTRTVGILGGGQLARMMAQAGKRLGLEFIFLETVDDALAVAFEKGDAATETSWLGETSISEMESGGTITKSPL